MAITLEEQLKGVSDLEFVSKKISVSIIIPFFNVENKISRILECLKEQTDNHFEVIFVDDGSSDHSEKIVTESKNRIKCYGVRVISQDHQGPALAREVGLKYARGAYVYFPDADDIISNRLVEFLVLSLRRGNKLPNILSFGFEVNGNISDKLANPEFGQFHLRIGTIKEYLIDATTKRIGFGYLWNKFICRKFIEESSLHFGDYQYDEDAIFLAEAYYRADSIAFSNVVLYRYIQYSDSVTHVKKNYSQSVRSLSRLNQVTDQLCYKYGLSNSGLQTRIRLRLIFAMGREKVTLSSKELSELKSLIKSLSSAHQFISNRDKVVTGYLKLFGIRGLNFLLCVS